jgi:SMI1 / KNR4 family (SUKH-1)
LNELLASFGGIEPTNGDQFNPMSDKQVRSIENRLGASFPNMYRQYLTTYGASRPKQLVNVRPAKPLPREITSNGKLPFEMLYGVGGNVDLQSRLSSHSRMIPANMISIGSDGTGSMYLLAIKDEEAGKVFYWDGENDPLCEEDYLKEYGKPRPPEAMFQNVHLVAESFEDFLRRLELEDAKGGGNVKGDVPI